MDGRALEDMNHMIMQDRSQRYECTTYSRRAQQVVPNLDTLDKKISTCMWAAKDLMKSLA